MRYIAKNILQLTALGLLLATCSHDLVPPHEALEPGKLSLALSVVGKAHTRAAADNDEAESRLLHADVFFFSTPAAADAPSCIYYERVTPDAQGMAYLNFDKDKPENAGAEFTIYVVANSTRSAADFAAIFGTAAAPQGTLKQLQDMTEYTDFYAAANANDTGPVALPQSFLMDGKSANVLKAADLDPKEVISVTLTRAAAKIVVNITYGEGYAPYNRVQKRIHNYATRTPLLAEASTADRALTSMSKFVAEESGDAAGSNRRTVVFYAYANTWQTDDQSSWEALQQETYLVLNLPVTISTTPDGDPGADPVTENRAENYYQITLNNFHPGESPALKRNHLYTINATLKALGAGEMDTPIQLKDVHYQVSAWHDVDIEVDKDPINFLEVNKEALRIVEKEQDRSLRFTSSSYITAIEILDVTYIDKYGQVKTITANGTAYPDGATYYPTVTYNEDQLSGIITIKSKQLINVPKHFTLKITNETGQEQTVKVEQYPLEYVTSTQGWYSYREDFGASFQNRPSGGKHSDLKTPDSERPFYFKAKVVETINNDGTSNIRGYKWTGKETPVLPGKEEQDEDNVSARMYHVNITTASSEYKIGYPRLDPDNGYTLAEDDDLVSPSFMIASQLGATNATDGGDGNYAIDGSDEFQRQKEQAERHCKQYVEVTGIKGGMGNDGQLADEKNENPITYDDWRLPTKAEIAIIYNYQKETDSAIDDVLSAHRYWTAGGVYTIDDNSSLKGTFVRCIRDVRSQPSTRTQPKEGGNQR